MEMCSTPAQGVLLPFSTSIFTRGRGGEATLTLELPAEPAAAAPPAAPAPSLAGLPWALPAEAEGWPAAPEPSESEELEEAEEEEEECAWKLSLLWVMTTLCARGRIWATAWQAFQRTLPAGPEE